MWWGSANRARALASFTTLGLSLAFGGCSREGAGERSAGFGEPEERSASDEQIDIAAFPKDPATRRRVLYLPFAEAAARLGSLRFSAKSHFVFSRGGEEYVQDDTYEVKQDSKGHFHVVLNTSRDRLEVYVVEDDVFVRQGHGQIRQRHRRNVDTEAWCELAWSGIRESLEVFMPYVHIYDPRPERTSGRQAMRYKLRLTQAPGGSLDRLPVARLPVAPLARWRELARPLDMVGHLWVDKKTGVMLKIQVDGRLEVADRNVRPTQLLTRYEASVSEITKVGPVKAPEGAVAAGERTDPPRDLLSFFAEHLPPLEK